MAHAVTSTGPVEQRFSSTEAAIMAQPEQDQEHLRLLSIFHYAVGGLAAVFSCLPLIYVAVGVFALRAPHLFSGSQHQEPPPAFVGWLLIVLGVGMTLVGWAVAAMTISAGRFLARRVHYAFCFAVACVECLFAPFGTVLGVFTLVVLVRPSVKWLFLVPPGAPAAAPPPPAG